MVCDFLRPFQKMLYVFVTRFPNGQVTRGTAGLPLEEMRKYREMLDCSPDIVGAPDVTNTIQVRLPLQRRDD